MNYVHGEFTIGGVYFPPLLTAGFLGMLAAGMTVMLLNRYRLLGFVYLPEKVRQVAATVQDNIY